MSILSTLTTDNSIENEKDSLGGGYILDSGLYNHTIAMAYISKSSGGALGLVLTLKGTDNKEHRQTLWMTSGTAKGGKNYYERDGKKNYLPGFLAANSLALLTVGKEISELDTEEKVVNVYSSEARAEVPTKVDVVMDLLGKEIITGVIRQIVDKTAKADNGQYLPTGETREENEIDKFFRASDRKTTTEIRAQVEEAKFIDSWKEKFEGQIRDKSTKGGAVGKVGSPRTAATNAASGTKKPTQSLFA